MNNYHDMRDKVSELVKRWKEVIEPEIEDSGKYGETNTRQYLIDPLLEALNWVDDGSKKIVDNEFAVKHKTGTGSADYALKVDGEAKILVEAKDAVIKDIENGYDMVYGVKRTYPRQLSNYCHDLNQRGFNIKFAILTNGREFILYNMQWADISSEREKVFHLYIEDFDKTENLDRFWALERNNFVEGSKLNEIIRDLHDFRMEIDKDAVQNLLECKDLLSDSILHDYEKNVNDVKKQIDSILTGKVKKNGMPNFSEMPEDEMLMFFIKEASSSVINKVLFIRILEDKNFLTPKLTKRKIEEWKDYWGYKDYREIMKLFREACTFTEQQYNGGLFELSPYDEISYNPDIIKKIIYILGDIKFKEIDSDIIGRIYEIYLGQVLKVESEIRGKKRTKYVADNKERKKLGQYYTPKFVVDFIVKNTLGKLIEGKKPEEISKIRILDPACGSGSFLINAYDTLSEYYENWNNAILKKIEFENKKKGASLDRYQDNGTVPNYKNLILKENIHGVDLNDLSVQIAEINLWLRALEKDKKLIKLNKNILHGNSLITGVEDEKELALYKKELEEIKKITEEIKDYYDKDELKDSEKRKLAELESELKSLKNKINPKLNENLKSYFGEQFSSVHAFNWEVEFPKVTQEGGFDVVIGNPPWGAKFSVELIKYLKQSKQLESMTIKNTDSYLTFIEKMYDLLNEEGNFAFIVPDTFLRKMDLAPIRKFILDKFTIQLILECGNVFEETKGIEDVIFVFSKNKNSDNNIFSHLILSKDRSREDRLQMIHKNIFDFSAKEKQEDILEAFGYRFGYLPGKKNQEIINKIEQVGTRLRDIKTIQIFRGSEGGKNLILPNKKNNKYYPILIPDDISRYESIFAERYFPIKDTPKKYEREKIVAIRIRNQKLKQRIIATLDTDKLYCLKTLQIICLDELSEWNLKGILGILNSKLINYYCKYFLADDMNKEYLESIPIINTSKNIKFLNIVNKLLLIKNNCVKIKKEFDGSLSNQSISDQKSCKFSHYFDHYELYDMQRETSNKINEISAKILSLKVREEGNKLVIYMTNFNEEQKHLWKDIKAVTLTIKDDDVRKFLFYAINKFINEKRGKGFGKGNLLELLKKIEVPVYKQNVMQNIEVIHKIMKEFNHNTKDLWWKDESKKEKFSSLTEMEEEIKKTDKEIDDMVYRLYEITEEEKKVIEESLR